LWRTKIDGACLGEIACDAARCYLGARNGRFYAIDLITGKIEWQVGCETILRARDDLASVGKEVPGLKPRVWADGCVALAGDRVLFSVSHQVIEDAGAIVAADKRTGKVLWIAHHPTQVCGRFAVTGGRIIAATQDRQLISVRLADGGLVSAMRLPKADRGEFAGVAEDNDALFLAGADATVSRIALGSVLSGSR